MQEKNRGIVTANLITRRWFVQEHFCYHFATRTSTDKSLHADHGLSDSSVFPSDSLSCAGPDWNRFELLISGPL